MTSVRGMYCIYVKYDKREFSNYQEEAIKQVFEAAGYVFLTVVNSDLSFKTTSNESLIYRKNLGFDLGAFRDALSALRAKNDLNEVVFINDSIFWSSKGIKSVLKQIEDFSSGVFFMTDSFQPFHHYQSYFFAAKGKNSIQEVSKWLNTCRNWRFKFSAIEFGELQNSNFFLNSPKVLFSQPEIFDFADDKFLLQENLDNRIKLRLDFCLKMRLRQVPLNPMHYYWRELIELGLPGIKRDLLLLNPANIPDLDLEFLGQFSLTSLPKPAEIQSEIRKGSSFIHVLRRKLRF
jgi:hypothetical protein